MLFFIGDSSLVKNTDKNSTFYYALIVPVSYSDFILSLIVSFARSYGYAAVSYSLFIRDFSLVKSYATVSFSQATLPYCRFYLIESGLALNL